MTQPRAGRFRRRLTAIVLLLAVVPVIAVGWNLIAVNQAAVEDTNRELMFSVIDDISHVLDGAFATVSLGVDAIGLAAGNDQLSGGERTAAIRQIVAVAPGMSVVGLYDQTGARIDVVRRVGDTTPVPEQLAPALRTSADTTKRALGEVVRGATGPIVPIVQPIRIGDQTWYAYAPVSLAGLDTRVAEIARDRFAGDPSSVFVVDRRLRIVSHPDPEQAQAMGDASQLAILQDFAAARGGKQVLVFSRYPSPEGEMVGAVRSLPSTPFAVVAQQPYARAFASIARMRWIVIVVVGVTALFAAAAALLIARRISAPIGKLVAFSGELAARNFAATADVHTGDELELLGGAMTDAARALGASEVELLEQAAIRADLGRYLPNQLVDKIVRREQSLELGGQRRTVTVLFADVAAFTQLTESQPPEVVVAILNELFTILTEIVFRHGGTVDKFIGDCVMAFWNAPDDQPDHAARAVAAATDMLHWLEIGNEAWQLQHGVTIHLAIGVNTGEVIVGNLGSESRMTYTCIGDTVNVAARLEGMARPQQILVSAATRAAAATSFDYVAMGAQRVPGRVEPIDVFEVTV